MYQWKSYNNRWKGVGIYHLTFVLRERHPILGSLLGDVQSASVEPSPIGRLILDDIHNIEKRHVGVQVYCSMIMPDHVHLLLYIKEEIGKSVKELARGMRQGWKHLALEADFAPPFIRPLYHKGQLNAMFQYIQSNPRRAMLRRLNPDLFRLRRELQVEGLTFTALGNLFLLDYPQRQVIECSRSASEEQIDAQQTLAIQVAVDGAVSYSGTISAGEKHIVRAIREAGLPVVVVLNDGFPASGSEYERFYKPGGVYFEACATGRLLLLEPTATTLESERVIAMTEQTLHDKAEAKHQDYVPLPHTSKRWRMVANNCIARLLANRES